MTEMGRELVPSNERASVSRAEMLANEPTSYVNRLVNYARANPVETALATAGVAFVAGAIFFGPRLYRRRDRDLRRVLEKSLRQAKRLRSDAPSLKQLSNWVKAQLPT